MASNGSREEYGFATARIGPHTGLFATGPSIERLQFIFNVEEPTVSRPRPRKWPSTQVVGLLGARHKRLPQRHSLKLKRQTNSKEGGTFERRVA